jgi:hypothetical protein
MNRLRSRPIFPIFPIFEKVRLYFLFFEEFSYISYILGKRSFFSEIYTFQLETYSEIHSRRYIFVFFLFHYYKFCGKYFLASDF